MDSIGAAWGQAADKWDEVIGQVGDDDWGKPTTCDDWTVKDLVDHAMHWQGQGAGVFGAQLGDSPEWSSVRQATAEALADPANLEGTVEAFGGMQKQAIAGLITADLLIHAWDLAKSIDADAQLPEGAAAATLMGLQRLPEPMLRSENMFGPAVEVGENASVQDQLIGFVGRTP